MNKIINLTLLLKEVVFTIILVPIAMISESSKRRQTEIARSNSNCVHFVTAD